MKPRFTLVPSSVFSEEKAREILSEVVLLSPEEPLSFAQVPQYDAVLIYAGERSVVYDMMMSTCKISDYNKIVASWDDGVLSLVVAQGEHLMLCNCYDAADFTTAEYFIFMVLKKLQINPEISPIHFTRKLELGQIESLLSYFKSVEVLRCE